MACAKESQRGRMDGMGEPGWPSPTAWPGWGGIQGGKRTADVAAGAAGGSCTPARVCNS